jgi:hypothetical protein
LSSKTGRVLASYAGVDRVYVNRLRRFELWERQGRRQIELRTTAGRTVAKLPMLSFAMLDAGFGTDSVCVTESTGPVRCFDLTSGSEVWHYTPRKGKHVLRVCYSCGARAFFGVEWSFLRGGPREVVKLDCETGERSEVTQLGDSVAEVFCHEGNELLTSDGRLIDLLSGRVKRRLRFPRLKA